MDDVVANKIVETYLVPLFERIGLFARQQSATGSGISNATRFLNELKLSDKLLVTLKDYREKSADMREQLDSK